MNGKAIIISFTMLTVFVGSAFANDIDEINKRVKQSFDKEFGGAQFVKWSEAGDYLKANFVLGDHRAEAFFGNDGELLGCVRDLFFDQLPLSVMTTIDKRFANADILDVREITNTEGTTYTVSLEHEQKKFRVKTDTGGNVVSMERI